MPDLLKAVILGVIQGLTEFLPVSSTGHLVIAEEALGISHGEFGLRFDAAIHLGTLTAVLVYYRTLLLSLAGDWLMSLRTRDWAITPNSRLAWLLLLGTIPAGLAGLALESTAEDTFRSPALVAAMLILFSGPLLLAEWVAGRHSALEASAASNPGAAPVGSGAFALHSSGRELSQASTLDALIYGVAQSIALIPGVSRSGITISAAMFDGFKREQAAVFTFLLSAPIIAAAGGKQVFDIARGEASGSNDLAIYAVGLITAAIVGYAAIAFLLRYLRTNTLYVFVAYRIALGVLVLGLVAAGVF